MNRWLLSAIFVWVISLTLWVNYSFGGDMDKETWFVDSSKSLTFKIAPMVRIMLTSPSGKQAIIDFGGDKIEYSGDLPVSEAAKIFFEAVFHEKSCCEELRKIKEKK